LFLSTQQLADRLGDQQAVERFFMRMRCKARLISFAFLILFFWE